MTRWLFRTARLSLSNWRSVRQSSTLTRYLTETTGPISVASYMRQCLTNPEAGYYVNRDPFGVKGDFITSPEISQMFGELIGIWVLAQWISQGSAMHWNLVEYGPGRGTLIDDMLRALQRFPQCASKLHAIHLVEASPILREAQRQKLCGNTELSENDGVHQSQSTLGPNIYWYDDHRFLPKSLSSPFLIAHEFLDALPIHKFEKTSKGWRELLVDVEQPTSHLVPAPKSESSPTPFQLTLAPHRTAYSATLPTTSKRYDQLPPPSRIEISPEAFILAQEMAKLISTASSGACLLIDYGPADRIPIDSLRGIKAHKMVSPFLLPGEVDLSADVDFLGIKETIETSKLAKVHGPVEQGTWLHALGIGARATMLTEKQPTVEGKNRIRSEYERLTERGGGAMGKAYKFMALTPTDSNTPVGFGGNVQ